MRYLRAAAGSRESRRLDGGYRMHPAENFAGIRSHIANAPRKVSASSDIYFAALREDAAAAAVAVMVEAATATATVTAV